MKPDGIFLVLLYFNVSVIRDIKLRVYQFREVCNFIRFAFCALQHTSVFLDNLFFLCKTCLVYIIVFDIINHLCTVNMV